MKADDALLLCNPQRNPLSLLYANLELQFGLIR